MTENPQKTKILYVITKSNWGGAQRYVYDLATSLPKETFDVEVVLGGSGPLFDKLVALGIPTTSIPNLGRDISIKDDWAVFVTLIKLFHSKKPDVIHLNSSKIGAMGALAGRLTRIPKIVFTAHGWAFNENRSSASKLVLKLIYWFTILLSHKTIAVSEYMRQTVFAWPIVYKKVTTIYNGIRPEALISKVNARHELTRTNTKLNETLGKIPANKLVWIGTIAELHHIKGHDITLRAMRQMIQNQTITGDKKQYIYTIIGAGEERDDLTALIDKLDLREHVFLLGHIENASQYLKAFDMFVLASRSEGLAYVLLEAGVASLPVIATAVGGLPEIVDDMKSGIIIQPNKSEEIAHAIKFLGTHEKVKKEYGSALHTKILETFSLDECIRKTAQMYTATLDR